MRLAAEARAGAQQPGKCAHGTGHQGRAPVGKARERLRRAQARQEVAAPIARVLTLRVLARSRAHEVMRGEPVARLGTVRDGLLRAEHEEYWEIVDRGQRVFEYLPPEHRDCLMRFFAWLEEPSGPAVSPTAH